MEWRGSGRVCIGSTMGGSVMLVKEDTDGSMDVDGTDDCGVVTGGSNGTVVVVRGRRE